MAQLPFRVSLGTGSKMVLCLFFIVRINGNQAENEVFLLANSSSWTQHVSHGMSECKSAGDAADTTSSEQKLISVVIPVFNEELCVVETLQRLNALRDGMAKRTDLEFVLVNDGSSDTTGQIIAAEAALNTHVKLVELSRNFGHQVAVTAGLDAARGDYIAIIDGDLQDPPELIEQMYEIALEGYDVVYGQRRERLGDTWFKKASASAFYRLLNALSDTPIPNDTGDFRLISRRVAIVLSDMRERNRFLRGMVPWVGFTSYAFQYDRDQRRAGTTKYPLRKMLGLATNAITSFSSKPLLLVVRLGLFMLGIGAFSGVCLLCLKLFTTTVVPGITSILISILVFNGLQILIIGVVGTYVAKMFDEIKGRPLYVVKRTINI